MRSAASLMGSGHISAKAGAKLKSSLAKLRGTRAQNTKMASFNEREKDEAQVKSAEIPVNEINHPTNQKGGRPTKGGGAGRESQVSANEIDAPKEQKGKWVPGGNVKSGNPATGNTRMKGKVPAQGGQYGGGGRNTQ